MKRKLLTMTVALLCSVGMWAQAAPTAGVEVAAGDYYIYNLGSGTYLNLGSSYTTHAIVDGAGCVITLAGSGTDYTLHFPGIDAAKYLGTDGWTDQGTSTTTFAFESVTVDGYSNVYKLNFGDSKYLYWNGGSGQYGNEVLVGDISERTATHTYWILIPKSTREAYTEASVSNPVDATWRVVNPDHERFANVGWSGDYSYQNNGTAGTVANFFERWTGTWNTTAGSGEGGQLYDAEVYQTLSSLPAGKYTLSATTWAQYQADTSKEITGVTFYAGASSATLSSAPSVTTNLDFVSTGGDVKIGLKIASTNANWVGFDNMRLSYVDPYISVAATEIVDATAQAGKWYKFTPTISGSYTIETTTVGDIIYTTNGEQLSSEGTGIVATASVALTAGTTYYLKSSSTQTIAIYIPASAPANYSELVAGDFFIVNAATGSQLGVAKNGWGTQAAIAEHGIPFTVALGDGVYTLNSHTYNNASAHFFNGTYVDGASTNLYITSIGDGKYSISTANGSEYVRANLSDNTVANNATSSNSPLAQWYFVSKENLVSTLSTATAATPADATFYIGDPDFSRNHILSALQNGKTTVNHGGETYPWNYTVTNYNFKGGANGNMCAETYMNGGGTITQALSVPNGKYVVKCQGFYKAVSGSDASYLIANDEKEALSVADPGSMSGASTQFSNGNYQHELTVYVAEGTLTIGIQGQAGNWTCFDNFELYYYGPTLAGEATALPETDMTAGAWYYFDIPVDGEYNLGATTLTDIVYETDGTMLIEDVTNTAFSTTPAELTAGRYYVKSATAQTLTVTAYSKNYLVGDATLSVSDGEYIQASTITVTFPSASTNDGEATLALVANATATVNEETVSLTAAEGGFTFDLGTLVAGTDYAVSIPASVYGYAAGDTYNTAISFTVHTPQVFDGTYYLYNPYYDRYISRGSWYGTRATADIYGVPYQLTTDAKGLTTLMGVDNNGYIKDSYWLYTDGNASQANHFIIEASTVEDYTTSGYLRFKNNELGGTNYLYVNATDLGDGSHGVAGNSIIDENISSWAQTVWQLVSVSDHNTAVATYPTTNKSNVITDASIATTADAFETYLSANYGEVDMSSLVNAVESNEALGTDWTWNTTRNGNARTESGWPKYTDGYARLYKTTGYYTYTIAAASLPAGIYKVKVAGFDRRTGSNDATLYTNYGSISASYMDVNGQRVRIKSWKEMYDAAGEEDTWAGQAASMNKGYADNVVYVYLDGSSDLTITVEKPDWETSGSYMCFGNVGITYYGAKANMTVQANKWGTFIAPFDVTIPEGIEAYTIESIVGSSMNLEAVETTITANKPVILKNTTETVYSKNFAGVSTAENDSYTASYLTGVYTAASIAASDESNSRYVLQTQDGVQAFYKVTSAFTATANRCYLTVPVASGVKAFYLDFNDTATGIGTIANGQLTIDNELGTIYNLAGQRMSKAVKGVNIVGGKKVLVK